MRIMGFPGWSWNWGWGWAATVGAIVLLGIFLLPWFFFLLNLQTTLNRVSDRNRAMPAGHVWLNFIPIFNLGWFIYTVTKVRDSVRGRVPDARLGPRGRLRLQRGARHRDSCYRHLLHGLGAGGGLGD